MAKVDCEKEAKEIFYYYDYKRDDVFINMSFRRNEYSAKFIVNKEQLKKSIWEFYRNDELLIRSSLECILGSVYDENNIKRLCSSEFSDHIFHLLDTKSIEKVHYLLTGEEIRGASTVSDKESEYNITSEHRITGIY